jgi:hypothetical protein
MPLIVCPTCGRAVDGEPAACPNCGAPLGDSASTPPGGGTGAAPGGALPEGHRSAAGSSVPFEDPSKPFVERLLSTVGQAFANPKQLFSNLPSENIGPPVLYGVMVGTAAMWIGLLWQGWFGGLLGLAGEISAEELAVDTGVLMVLAVMGPLLVLAGLFITSAIYHLMLLILGDGARGFGITLRAVCYGSTPGLLGVVPFCGGIIGGLWGMVLTIMAAWQGHRTNGWVAILAYFLPLILCCSLFFFVALLFGMLGAALAT